MVIAMYGKGICGMGLGTKMEMQLHRCREQLSSSSRMNEDKHSLYPVVTVFMFFGLILLLFSCVHLFATPWTAAHQASLSITNS